MVLSLVSASCLSSCTSAAAAQLAPGAGQPVGRAPAAAGLARPSGAPPARRAGAAQPAGSPGA